MRPSRLNKRITIQQYSEVKNEEGVHKKSWSTFATPLACVKPLSGSQVYTSNAKENKSTVKVNIRYLKGLVEEMRILIDDVPYEIDYIEDVDYMHVEQWITLKKVI